jgi:glycosyltransferase involved in cell wall biosynthesis
MTSNPPLAATVLIATRERPAMLGDTLRSLLSARRVPREIIVVDQSSVPNAELAKMGNLRGCEIRYIHSRTRGLARARNVGLRLASQTAVVILDDDMLVDDDSLERLLAGMMEGDGKTVTTATRRTRPRPGASRPGHPF